MKKIISLAILLMAFSASAQGPTRFVNTIAELQAIDPDAASVSGSLVYTVAGRTTAGDWGNPRVLRYVAGSVATVDNGCVFSTLSSGRWIADDCSGNPIDIRWFGAVADNATNNTAAFSNAITAAIQWRGESGGGTVYVPAGDFRLNWNMVAPYANEESITITGDGPGATALRPYTNTSPVLKLLGRNITLEKLMIKGDILSPDGIGLQLGDTNLATGAVVAANFRDLYILDFTTGLYIEGIDQAHFDGMVIQRCTNGLLASPRWFATSGTNAVMSKVKFTRSVWLGNYGDAITIRGGYAEQIDFDTCVIEQNYGKAVVIQQYNAIAGNPFRGFQFRNCFFEFNNFASPVGDYYDIEFQPAVGTGANAIYSSMIEGCWFQTVRSSHTPIHILNGGDYRIQNNDFISNNPYFISITNSPVIDLDVAFTKVLVTNGSPQINWVSANRVELRGLTNAAPSLTLTNTGRLLFSDGVNAPDLNVYRSASRVLAVEGTYRSIGTAASDQAFLSSVSGDAQGRFTTLNSGRFEWGDGAGARSIFMERAGSGVMEMKGATWTFNRANTTDWAIQTYVTGDSQYRLSLRADGRMEWSDGANPAGISLAPASGNILNLLATYRVQRTNATDSAYLTGVLGESTSRFEIDSVGRFSWGDGTGPRTHASLERTALGELTLKTNLVIPAGGSITVNSEAINDFSGTNLLVSGGKLNVTGLSAMAFKDDAPTNTTLYGRSNNTWTAISIPSPTYSTGLTNSGLTIYGNYFPGANITAVTNGTMVTFSANATVVNTNQVAQTYGELYIHDNTAAQSLTNAGTYYLLRYPNTFGNVAGITQTSTNRFTITQPGAYLVTANMSFSGTANATYTAVIHTNGVEVASSEGERKLGTGGEVGSMAIGAVINLVSNDVVDLRAKGDASPSSLVMRDANFRLALIASPTNTLGTFVYVDDILGYAWNIVDSTEINPAASGTNLSFSLYNNSVTTNKIDSTFYNFITSQAGGQVRVDGTSVTNIKTSSDIAFTTGSSEATPALTTTAVTPGSYSNATITVDSKGRLTAASVTPQPQRTELSVDGTYMTSANLADSAMIAVTAAGTNVSMSIPDGVITTNKVDSTFYNSLTPYLGKVRFRANPNALSGGEVTDITAKGCISTVLFVEATGPADCKDYDSYEIVFSPAVASADYFVTIMIGGSSGSQTVISGVRDNDDASYPLSTTGFKIWRSVAAPGDNCLDDGNWVTVLISNY